MPNQHEKKLWILVDIINSKAFNSLTGFAPHLLFHILKKRKMENCQNPKAKKKNWVCINSDSINITYSEFSKSFGVTKPRMSKAIGQLLGRGFISIIHQGGGCNKDKSIYAISDNWMIWHKDVVMEVRTKEAVKRGFCKPKHD